MLPRIIIVFISLGFAIYPRIMYFLPLHELRDHDEERHRHRHHVPRIHQILHQHNTYYRKLSRAGQNKFVGRVLYLMKLKRFVGYHDLKVSFEMRTVVLSAQVQLTFGYRRFSLSSVKRYILYPDEFYSAYFKSNLKGLTGSDFVTLSWNDTLKGFQDSDDNLNLALHEISHALVLNYLKHRLDDYQTTQLFAEMNNEVARHYIHHTNNSHLTDYLRDYAYTNIHEFLAVSIEHFFETPMEFQSRLPNLYRLLKKLLNQDPLNVTNDYRYD